MSSLHNKSIWSVIPEQLDLTSVCGTNSPVPWVGGWGVTGFVKDRTSFLVPGNKASPLARRVILSLTRQRGNKVSQIIFSIFAAQTKHRPPNLKINKMSSGRSSPATPQEG